MIPSQLYNIYIASCAEHGGIYQFHLHGDGSLKYINHTMMDRPMYMTIDDDRMYILLREPFKDNKESGLIFYDINADGKLINSSEIISTKGEVACHLSVNEETVYCANYISGSVIKMPDKLVMHRGKGVNPLRQNSPHAHYIGTTPDRKYICAVDLGVDSVYLYDKNLNFVDKAKVPQGHGARHLVFSDDGKYCFVANELKSTVSLFEYKNERLVYVDTISCLPTKFAGETAASAIRCNNNYLYVSNRGLDTISVFEFSNEKLKFKDTYSCNGSFPRDFDIVGEYIVCTNEKSDNVVVLDKNNFNVAFIENNIKSPICVVSQKI